MDEYSFSLYSLICKTHDVLLLPKKSNYKCGDMFCFSWQGVLVQAVWMLRWMLVGNSECVALLLGLQCELKTIQTNFLTFNLHISKMMWLEKSDLFYIPNICLFYKSIKYPIYKNKRENVSGVILLYTIYTTKLNTHGRIQ